MRSPGSIERLVVDAGPVRTQASDLKSLIVISNLTKIFHPLQLRLRSFRPLRREPPVPALRGLNLTVGRGDVLGLLGTNGAGKTTLLKILGTLILPTAGSAVVSGWDLVREADRVRSLVGMVTTDERSFYWRLTGRQNLEFFAAFQGLDSSETTARIEDLRCQLELEALDRRFGLYSTGMRHRLAIARALLRRPAILLLDEPTRSLDPIAAAGLRRLIRSMLVDGLGCTVLLATHNLQEAHELCDRIVVLHQGRLVGSGSIEDLRRTAHSRGSLSEVFESLVREQSCA